jgi:hypothetical protein
MTRDEAEAILTRAGEHDDDGFPLFEAAQASASSRACRASPPRRPSPRPWPATCA